MTTKHLMFRCGALPHVLALRSGNGTPHQHTPNGAGSSGDLDDTA